MNPTAETATRGAATFFGSVGIYCVYVGSTHEYYDLMGPGPGFFPIWIGALLTVLSARLLVASMLAARAGAGGITTGAVTGSGRAHGTGPFFPSRQAVWRISGMSAALAVALALLDVFGFRLTIFAFTFFAPRILEPQPPLRSVLVALFCGFGIAYAFEFWLNVRLPRSSVGVLAALGL